MEEKQEKIGVFLVGSGGYGTKEFLRVSAEHPYIEVAGIVSSGENTISLAELHPGVRVPKSIGTFSEVCFNTLKQYKKRVVILATPAHVSRDWVEENFDALDAHGTMLIDLSGAFRLRKESERKHHYDVTSTQLQEQFTFGLPEINREKIRYARYISNPGCFATAAILSLGQVKDLVSIQSICVDGKSGTSGAGRNLSKKFHHPECHSDSFPYKMGEHRHEAEMIDHLEVSIPFTFCPHVIPCSRGLITTSYITCETQVDLDRIKKDVAKNIRSEDFLILRDEPPHIRNVIGSNRCDFFITAKDNMLLVSSAIDNLGKGMIGQAIQNLNLMCGFPESTGLPKNGMGVI